MQVFISYSSKIRQHVAALERDLEEAGYQVWYDQELSGGQAWWSEILSQVRACDVFALALTPQPSTRSHAAVNYTMRWPSVNQFCP